MANPPKSEVAQLFAEQGVVLVHCSGEVKGSGNEETNSHTPLGRIVNAEEKRCDVCCSTIATGDTLSARNYYGPLGLIIAPVSFDNITVSCQGDAGTSLDENNKRRTLRGLGANSHSDILKAVSLRGTPLEGESYADPYNEICCEGYNLIGLFADNLKLSFQQTGWPPVITHSVDEIGAMLPELPLFLWVSNEGTFLRLQYDPIKGGYDKEPLHVRKVPISKIYDEPWIPNKAANPEPSAASD